MAAQTRARAKNFAGRPLTEDEVDRHLANDRMRASAFVVLFALIGLAILSLAMTPLAKTIAGTTTDFNVQISFAFNFALGVTALSGAGGCLGLNKARRHHKRRARRLEDELAVARGISAAIA